MHFPPLIAFFVSRNVSGFRRQIKSVDVWRAQSKSVDLDDVVDFIILKNHRHHDSYNICKRSCCVLRVHPQTGIYEWGCVSDYI